MKSILQTDDQRCFWCGVNIHGNLEWHHVYNGPNRRLADQDGLTVRLCRECHRTVHRDPMMRADLRHIAHQAWLERYGTQEEFRARYGREE